MAEVKRRADEVTISTSEEAVYSIQKKARLTVNGLSGAKPDTILPWERNRKFLSYCCYTVLYTVYSTYSFYSAHID